MDGERQAIISENELPPSDCLRRHVSFESLYGICDMAFFFPRLASASPVMTFLRVNRLLLMSIDSF